MICAASISTSAQDYARPETGTFIKDSERSGYGVLVVENNNPQEDDATRDAVAILTRADKRPLFMVYVREGESFEITGIEDGVYDFYFTVGNGWKSESGTFLDPEYYRTEDSLSFETEIRDTQVLYSVWTLSLEEVPGGNEEKIVVPAEEFPVWSED